MVQMAEHTVHTPAEFADYFNKLFTEHDKNNNGALEKDEARDFMVAINAPRPDGEKVDEDSF